MAVHMKSFLKGPLSGNDTFKAVLDKHINIAAMNPTASADPSSPHAPNVPSATDLPIRNNSGYVPNTGMYMGHLTWPQNTYLHHATAQVYGLPPNMIHTAARPSAPVASFPGVGSGSANNSFQTASNFYYPSVVFNMVYTTQVINPNQPLPGAAPPQPPSTPSLYNHRLSVPGGTAPYAGAHQNITPPLSRNPHAQQHHDAKLTTGSTSSFKPQATSSSTGQKRVGDELKDLEDREVKRIKVDSYGIWNDPNFKPEPELDEDGRQKFICSIDKEVILPGSYRKHIKSKTHVGDEVEMYGCSLCLRSYTRYDAFRRHSKKHAKQRNEGAQRSCSTTSQGSMSAASASPVAVPTTYFTFRSSTTSTATSSGSSTPNTVENAQISPPVDGITQSREAPSFADPVVPPVSSSSQSPETLVTETALI